MLPTSNKVFYCYCERYCEFKHLDLRIFGLKLNKLVLVIHLKLWVAMGENLNYFMYSVLRVKRYTIIYIFNFHPHEVVSRYRDPPQLQVDNICTARTETCQSC